MAVDLPVGWRHRADAGPFALAAWAEPWAGEFAPNLTVAVTTQVAGDSLDRYLARQLDGVARSLAEPLLLDAHIDPDERSVSFLVAHATTGVDLTLVQHHRVTDGYVIAAAGTALDADWAEVASDLLALVRSVRLA